jgi:hypothetical protein
MLQHLVVIKLMEASLRERFEILSLYLTIYKFIYRNIAVLFIIYHNLGLLLIILID